jgi:hypothetical protein
VPEPIRAAVAAAHCQSSPLTPLLQCLTPPTNAPP